MATVKKNTVVGVLNQEDLSIYQSLTARISAANIVTRLYSKEEQEQLRLQRLRFVARIASEFKIDDLCRWTISPVTGNVVVTDEEWEIYET